MLKRTVIFAAIALFAVVFYASCSGGAYVSSEPPAPKMETKPSPPPGQQVVWAPGHWEWRKGHWTWRQGHYKRTKPGKSWVDGHWKHSGSNRWKWVPGHWR